MKFKAKQKANAAKHFSNRRIYGACMNKALKFHKEDIKEEYNFAFNKVCSALNVNSGSEARKEISALSIDCVETNTISQLIQAVAISGINICESNFFMTRAPRIFHLTDRISSYDKNDFFA